MAKTKKRILALVLTLAMVFTALAVTAVADEPEHSDECTIDATATCTCDPKVEKDGTVIHEAECGAWICVEGCGFKEARDAVAAFRTAYKDLPAVEGVTAENAADIQAAAESFKGLSSYAKTLLEDAETVEANLETLEAAAKEAAEKAAADQAAAEQAAAEQAAADKVIRMIEALPEADKITLNDGDAFNAAMDAYEALTAEQAELVTNAEKLDELNEALAELTAAAGAYEAAPLTITGANKVAVGETITLTCDRWHLHSWDVSGNAVVTIRTFSNRAKVTGVKAGTVTVSCGDSKYTIEVTGSGSGGSTTKNYPVYVYMSFVDQGGNTLTPDALAELGYAGLQLNDHGWFTVGKIANGTSVQAKSGANATTAKAEALQELESIDRYKVNGRVINASIDVSSSAIDWNMTAVSSGADNYDETSWCWHLDGTLSVSTLRTYKVQYLEQGTDTSLADDKPGSAIVNTTVTESAIPITGYTVCGDPTNTITIGNNPDENVITFYYTKNTYTVTWKNADGTVLETDENVPYGTMPSYDGETPTKAADAQYTYTFKEWTPKIEAVKGDVTYTATYEEAARKYTVTFVDEDGTTVLKEATEYDYGTKAADIVKPADPTKASTIDHTYTFKGWSPTISDVTGNATYKATYEEAARKYTVTFVDEDGTTVLKEATEYDYGTKAADIVKPTTPTKAADAQHTYTFAGWDPVVADVTGNATYTATYSKATNKYAVTINKHYVDKDGKDTKVDGTPANVDYGTVLSDLYSRAAETYNQVTYRFDKAVTTPENATTVTGDTIIDLYYDVDALADTSIPKGQLPKDGGDGIPDKYQVVVNYKSSNTQYGTVKKISEVITLKDDDGKYAATGSIEVGDTAACTSLSRVYFSNWTMGGKQISSSATLNATIEVKGGESYTVTANFGRSSSSGHSGGKGGTTTIKDPEVPLAGDLQLNKDDHFAYIKGYADGTVRPNNFITRAQVATIFYRLMTKETRTMYFSESNDFSDVSDDYWANKAISTLSNAGIITGFSDGTFRPNAFITRAQFAAIAARFSVVTEDLPNPFSDVPEGYWAEDLIAFAADVGWVNGYADGTFRPTANITRAAAMKLINNVLERQVDEEGLLKNATQWNDCTPDDWCYYIVMEATNSHDWERRSKKSLVEDWTALTADPVWDE